ncbi:CCAAT-BINDING FACTOR-RELATED [Salix purpurea]|uniref:CCAAT-BINDING FACTOR-RELATED n=1 Tax=Salix purpurea TaxID=77065 RepID=A0A9Q0THP8_SALPP|nr:CCAAT-BINDING FACTOR-RELATED [Salix purpurea]
MDSESDSAEDEDDSPASSSEDDVSDEDELLMEDSSKEPQESQPQSDHNGNQPLTNSSGSSLPGGYDPRHREPSYCNADHASWWELMVLASHAHPSVATMAGTLLSGANIVYNGNPLNDLSLTAFLDKFMEKKPKQTAWHGGSQIEPAKKLDMNMHLIGPEILSLAEVDVPPEDLVFHKFYVNKMNTSKPKKKKKKKALLDSANLSHGAENEYDYDDLDQVVNEDDEDLVDDVEVDALSDTEGEDFDTNADSDNDTVDVGDADDGTDEDVFDQQKRKRKSRGKAGASPFASLEEYEHILNEDGATKKKSERKKKSKSLKKRKSSK